MNASRKRTGEKCGECILMRNHCGRRLRISLLSRPSLRCLFCDIGETGRLEYAFQRIQLFNHHCVSLKATIELSLLNKFCL